MAKEIINALTSKEGLILISLIGGIIIAVLTLIFIILRFSKKNVEYNKKTGSFKVSDDDDDDEDSEENNGDEKLNKYIISTDIMLLVEKIVTLTTKKVNLINQIPDKQKEVIKQKFLKVKGILQSKYLNVLSKKLGSKKNLTVHEDYDFYSVLIDSNLKDLIEDVVDYLKKNSIPDPKDNSEKGREKWSEYISDKVELIMQRHTDYLNNKYRDNRIITREEVHDFTFSEEIYLKIKDNIKDLFKKCIEINDSSKKEIMNSFHELQNFLETYLNIPQSEITL